MDPDFYSALPVTSSFERLTDPDAYVPLPEGWFIGVADVVQSTSAIDAGRYKTVNTAGAAVIAAISNALGSSSDFPFAFGGDGASFALAPRHEALARDTLARTAAWVRDDLGLHLRTALIPLDQIRAAGHDVRVARFAPSAGVSYAMFTGGGLAYAERQLKAGAYAIDPGPQGARPDLSGLSCRFAEITTERGVIFSMIVIPAGPDVDQDAFQGVVKDILDLVGDGESGHPVPEAGPVLQWPPSGFDLEARAARRPWQTLLISRLLVGVRTLASHLIFKSGVPVGRFDPSRYRRELVENTDFRKFDDGLRMTLDCSPDLATSIEARLEVAQAQGLLRFGTHRQTAALMTCFVPSPTRSDHVHFVDGAGGGYAAAAQLIKAGAATS